MMHRVLKPFPCSWDGLTLVDLNEGDERDFGTMADGLVAIGWIEAIEEQAPAIPEPAIIEPVAIEPNVPVAAPQQAQKPAPARRQRK
ncbi:hypothetical protein HFO15_19775 [Rhizobium laguerreae]|uniref:hypothetical protein n=1 Tax=Rhizobium laguerreae TaxID=1076926 RepID=UPI001C905EAC|nr:hypothetical protein [Rhizobium laguerreae]MBY3263867.1 hypothetical protein [Rhizobium laguerreae]